MRIAYVLYSPRGQYSFWWPSETEGECDHRAVINGDRVAGQRSCAWAREIIRRSKYITIPIPINFRISRKDEKQNGILYKSGMYTGDENARKYIERKAVWQSVGSQCRRGYFSTANCCAPYTSSLQSCVRRQASRAGGLAARGKLSLSSVPRMWLLKFLYTSIHVHKYTYTN